MKKLLISIGLVAATVVSAASHKSSSFLTGNYLVVSNNTAYTSATATWYYSYAAGTNIQANTANAAGLTNSSATVDVGLWAAADGKVSDNLNISVSMGTVTNYPNPYGVSVVANNGSKIATTALSTNVVTFVFAPIADELNASTVAADKFTFAVSATGTSALTIKTNLPSSLLVGSAGLRLVSITTDNVGSSPGVVINAVSLNGWIP